MPMMLWTAGLVMRAVLLRDVSYLGRAVAGQFGYMPLRL
jgi:hypothetical protein